MSNLRESFEITNNSKHGFTVTTTSNRKYFVKHSEIEDYLHKTNRLGYWSDEYTGAECHITYKDILKANTGEMVEHIGAILYNCENVDEYEAVTEGEYYLWSGSYAAMWDNSPIPGDSLAPPPQDNETPDYSYEKMLLNEAAR